MPEHATEPRPSSSKACEVPPPRRASPAPSPGRARRLASVDGRLAAPLVAKRLKRVEDRLGSPSRSHSTAWSRSWRVSSRYASLAGQDSRRRNRAKIFEASDNASLSSARQSNAGTSSIRPTENRSCQAVRSRAGRVLRDSKREKPPSRRGTRPGAVPDLASLRRRDRASPLPFGGSCLRTPPRRPATPMLSLPMRWPGSKITPGDRPTGSGWRS